MLKISGYLACCFAASTLYAGTDVLSWGRLGLFDKPVRDIELGYSGIYFIYNDNSVSYSGALTFDGYTPPDNLQHVKSISASPSSGVAILEDGSLVGWGNNTQGELDFPSHLRNPKKVLADIGYTLIQTQGDTLYSFGSSRFPDTLANVKMVDADSYHIVAWMYDHTFREVFENFPRKDVPTPASLTGIKDLAIGGDHTHALLENGSVVSWGSDFHGFMSEAPATASRILASNSTSYAELPDGSIYAWGSADRAMIKKQKNLKDFACAYGSFAGLQASGRVIYFSSEDSYSAYYSMHTLKENLKSVVSIAAGAQHAIALREDGSVFEWGVWDTIRTPSNLETASEIAAGSTYSAILRKDGTLRVWNHETSKFYALNVTNDSVSKASGVKHIFGGYSDLWAVLENGNVISWGANSAKKILRKGGVKFASGANFGLELMNNGTVYVCLGDTTSRAHGLTNAKDIAVGADGHWVVLFNDGSIYEGDGTYNYPTEAPVGLSNIVAVASGASHSLALRADGAVVSWGDTLLSVNSTPSNWRNVKAIAAGSLFSVALQNEAPKASIATLASAFYGDWIEIAEQATQANTPIQYKSTTEAVCKLDNYTIQFLKTGTCTIQSLGSPSAVWNITVKPRPLTIKAISDTLSYGSVSLSYLTDNLLFEDKLSGRLALQDKIPGVGVYPILQGTLQAPANYSVTYVPGNLTVKPRTLEITVVDTFKILKTPDPKYRVSYFGLGYSADTTLLTNLSFTREPGESLGSYIVKASGIVSPNYKVTYNAGTLRIQKTGDPSAIHLNRAPSNPRPWISRNLYNLLGQRLNQE